jgi:hypothetical protein
MADTQPIRRKGETWFWAFEGKNGKERAPDFCRGRPLCMLQFRWHCLRKPPPNATVIHVLYVKIRHVQVTLMKTYTCIHIVSKV